MALMLSWRTVIQIYYYVCTYMEWILLHQTRVRFFTNENGHQNIL